MSPKVDIKLLYANEIVFNIGKIRHNGLLTRKKVTYRDRSVVVVNSIELDRRTYTALRKAVERVDPGITP